ncbi:MAG: trimethylamine methyltransferase [Gammaproteobacteria bacterium]|nr:trimethylamine methyltransferase [Gammaproteobacteria bacterium]
MTNRISRRRGSAREARLKMRKDAANKRPVHAGLIGGTYKPLQPGDLEKIHHTALEILETIGIGSPTPEVVEFATGAGCWIDDNGRLCFPKTLIEDVIAKAAREYTIFSRSPDHADVQVGGYHVNYSTSGEAVSLYEPGERSFRPSTLVDLYDLGRLVDRLDNIHQFGQMVIPTELIDPQEHDFNVAYALCAATQKPCEMAFTDARNVRPAIEMFDLVLGRPGRFAEKPFLSFGGCPIVSPLRFGEDNLDLLVETSKLGLINDIAIAPQAGATSPAAMAGTLAQVAAEGLACLAITNIIRPGCPMTFAIWPFISDLRTGSFTGGSGEEALAMSACAQLGRFYDLPTSVAASMTDSKLPDAQAGFEKGITAVTAGLAGANRILESAGMLGSLMGCSFEALMIDNDMLGMAQRVIAGIEVNDETLSLDVIREAALGPGHYLGQPQTLELMETDYLYPDLADRSAMGTWEEEGSLDIMMRARQSVKEVLSSHYPDHIDTGVDAAIRDKFPIKLAPAEMQAGNDRW